MRYLSKKAGQQFEKFFDDIPNMNNQTQEKEGSITIDKMPKRNPQSNNKVGEYVDYEEVE